MANDIGVYLLSPGQIPLTTVPFGWFRLGEATCENMAEPPCLRIAVTASGADLEGASPELQRVRLDWIDLAITLRTVDEPHRAVGRVRLERDDYPSMKVSSRTETAWHWEVDPADVEAVEASRRGDLHTPLNFRVAVDGIVRVVGTADGEFAWVCRAAHGGRPLYRVASSDWANLVSQLGYRTPLSQQALLELGALRHPAWLEAERRLEQARRHLRLGEDNAAIEACLRELEGLATRAYQEQQWLSLLRQSMPRQKAEAIAKLLSGMATWCNRVGHHRDSTSRDGQGDLQPMPLDHWEAELLVGATQMILTYAIRLRDNGLLLDRGATEQPPVTPA